MANYPFKQGRSYIAGIDKPFVISASRIIKEATKLGFRVGYVDECEKLFAAGTPFRTPSRCGDDWDWIAFFTRTGPSQSIDVPGRVKWIVDSTSPPQPRPGEPPPPVQPEPPPWVNPEAPGPLPTTPGLPGAPLAPAGVPLGAPPWVAIGITFAVIFGISKILGR